MGNKIYDHFNQVVKYGRSNQVLFTDYDISVVSYIPGYDNETMRSYLNDLQSFAQRMENFYKPYQKVVSNDFQNKLKKLSKKIQSLSEEEAKKKYEYNLNKKPNIQAIVTQYENILEILKDFNDKISKEQKQNSSNKSFFDILMSNEYIEL